MGREREKPGRAGVYREWEVVTAMEYLTHEQFI